MNKIITHLHELFTIVLREPNQYPIETYLHLGNLLGGFICLIVVFVVASIFYKAHKEDNLNVNAVIITIIIGSFALLNLYVIFYMADNGLLDNPLRLLNLVITIYFIIDVILFGSIFFILRYVIKNKKKQKYGRK